MNKYKVILPTNTLINKNNYEKNKYKVILPTSTLVNKLMIKK